MATEHLIDPSSLDREALALRGEIYWGVVSAVVDRELIVLHEGRSSLARRAASCLVAPQPGDAVLLARVGPRIYALAVLEQASGDREIHVEGELRLRASEVTIEADEEVRVRGRGVSLAGKTLALAAERASWVAEQLELFAQSVSVETTRIRQVAALSEVVIESVKETLGRSYREIAEGEHVKAGTMTLSLRGMLRAHADTALVTAKKLVKMSADQIHLG